MPPDAGLRPRSAARVRPRSGSGRSEQAHNDDGGREAAGRCNIQASDIGARPFKNERGDRGQGLRQSDRQIVQTHVSPAIVLGRKSIRHQSHLDGAIGSLPQPIGCEGENGDDPGGGYRQDGGRSAQQDRSNHGDGLTLGFKAQLVIWLWLTVLFGTFAEALAEGRGKAQAASLRATKAELRAKKLIGVLDGLVKIEATVLEPIDTLPRCQ
ncbi:MAG: hypothetical protein M1823_006855, partial [Watsoniomyces obsoletus]